MNSNRWVLVISCFLLQWAGRPVFARSVFPNELDLTGYINAGQSALAREYSRVGDLPDIQQKSFAGYINVDAAVGNHLFFWYFESAENPDTSPLLIWLNGGPGVSSMQGVIWENGPIEPRERIDGSLYMSPRATSWTNKYSVLYIDSPAGVGFSYSDNQEEGYRKSSLDVAQDLYSFMGQFYQVFPELAERKLYIGGQSYAGKYVTHFAHLIHEADDDVALAGIYLGGPFLRARDQIRGTFQNLYSYRVLGFDQADDFIEKLDDYADRYEEGTLTESMGEIMGDLYNFEFMTVHGLDNFFQLDIVQDDAIADFMNNNIVKDAVHASLGRTFQNFNTDVFNNFGGDLFEDVTDKLTDLIENYKVMIFDGAMDNAVSSLGTETAIANGLTGWSGYSEYLSTPAISVWYTLDEEMSRKDVTGFYSLTQTFCRVTIKNAGHQVPRDQPEAAFKMISDFIEYGCVNQTNVDMGPSVV